MECPDLRTEFQPYLWDSQSCGFPLVSPQSFSLESRNTALDQHLLNWFYNTLISGKMNNNHVCTCLVLTTEQPLLLFLEGASNYKKHSLPDPVLPDAHSILKFTGK